MDTSEATSFTPPLTHSLCHSKLHLRELEASFPGFQNISNLENDPSYTLPHLIYAIFTQQNIRGHLLDKGWPILSPASIVASIVGYYMYHHIPVVLYLIAVTSDHLK